MEAWNHLINIALLGTDKRQLKQEDVAQLLPAEVGAVFGQQLDKEDLFLQVASLAYNYRQCGQLPVTNATAFLPKAESEEKPYCSPAMLQVLKEVLEADSAALLELWLTQCINRNLIVPPDMVPTLFETAVKYPHLQLSVLSCTGKRGEWLSLLNEAWKFEMVFDEENLWRTGTLGQRKKVLEQIRKLDPARGRQWLEQTWPQENAQTKQELLTLLSVNLTKEDEPFLLSIQGEKSIKVKEAAQGLLKQIPEAELVQQYWKVLSASFRLKKEGGVFGIGAKTRLDLTLTGMDEALFKTGIEKLSNQKEFTDDEYIIYQLIEAVPPELWEQQFEKEPQEVLRLFKDDKSFSKYLPAFVTAIFMFGDARWASAFIQVEDRFYAPLLEVLPSKDFEAYGRRFMEVNGYEIIPAAIVKKEPWSADFSLAALKHMATNGYGYHKGFFNSIAHLLPFEIRNRLTECEPKEVYQKDQWNRTSEHIQLLLDLKNQIKQSFQS